jgi:hypothetical protein
MGDKLESVADRSGETKQFAPEVIAVTEAIHEAGRDANHMSKPDIIKAASPVFDKFARNGGPKHSALVPAARRNDAPKVAKPAAKAPPKATSKPVQKTAPKFPTKAAVKAAPKPAQKPAPAPKPVAKAVPARKSKLKVAQAPKVAAAPAPVRPAPVVKKVTVDSKKSNAALAKAAQPAPHYVAEQPEQEMEPSPATIESEARVEESADIPPGWDPPAASAQTEPAEQPESTESSAEEQAGEQETEEHASDEQPSEPAPADTSDVEPEQAEPVEPVQDHEQDPTSVPNDGMPKTQEEALEEERRVQESLQTLTNESTLSLLDQPGYNPYIAMTTMILSALQICEFFDKMPGNDQRKAQLDRLAVESQDLVEKYKGVAAN